MIRPTGPGWKAANRVISTLGAAWHEAVLAGGCVRDMLLAIPPKDYDVATDAAPARVLELFPKARKVGAKFGVVLVHLLGEDIEVATFRTEGVYSDGRHPDRVAFGTAEQDAQRRDFTINGLFYDPRGDRVIDFVGGREDLERRVIRAIGQPEQRFSEDHLRMLRAVRLSARLGFAVDPITAEAVRLVSPQLLTISAERIWMELEQILCHPTRAKGWELLRDFGLRGHVSPCWPADAGPDDRAAARLAALPNDVISTELALAAVVCDFSRTTVTEIARSLRLSNRQSDGVTWLVHSLPVLRDGDPDLAGLKTLMARPCWPDLLALLDADLVARGMDAGIARNVRSRADRISAKDVAPPPLVTGNDLAAMGHSPGRKFGEVLAAVYRRQLNEEIGSRTEALALAEKLLSAS